MFLEDQRRDVWKITDSIDDREANVRIILRHEFNDWGLRKADADNEVVITFGKGAHCRLDGSRIAGFDITQHYGQLWLAATRAVGPLTGLCTLRSGPRRSIERAVILAADIENNTYPNLRLVVGSITRTITGRPENRQQTQNSERCAEYSLHS